MILVHGDCGSGKSAALRALEEAPPAGYRAAYLPVPTLDLAGVARWCLERVGTSGGDDPVATLRAAARGTPLLILIDDAERLPLDSAAALAEIAHDAAGGLAIVAACASELRANESIAAFGAPELTVAVDAQAPERAAAAARSVREFLAPDPRIARTATLSRAALASARLGGAYQAARERAVATPPPAVRVAASAPSAPIAAAPEIASVPPPPALPPRTPRTVPLSLAIAMTATAFLVPVAFVSGLFLGEGWRSRSGATGADEALPAVAAAPPQTAPPEAAAPAVAAQPVAPAAEPSPAPRAPRVARAERRAAAVAVRPPEAARAERVATRTPAPRARVRAEAAPRVARASEAQPSAATTAPAAAAPEPQLRPEPRQFELEPRRAAQPAGPIDEWGAGPTLISVSPGDGGR